jgi:hypothetical protein
VVSTGILRSKNMVLFSECKLVAMMGYFDAMGTEQKGKPTRDSDFAVS